jgi:hypothetical protein
MAIHAIAACDTNCANRREWINPSVLAFVHSGTASATSFISRGNR